MYRILFVIGLLSILSPTVLRAADALPENSVFRNQHLFEVTPLRAEALVKKKDYAAAIREYDKIVAYMEKEGAKILSGKFPHSNLQDIYLGRARAKLALGRIEDADRDFLKVLAEAGIAAKLTSDEKIALYSRAIARDPNNRSYHLGLADAFGGDGGGEKALEIYARLLDTAADDAERAEVHFHRAPLFGFPLKQPDAAPHDYGMAIKLNPTVEYFFHRARFRGQKKDLEGAAEDLTAALKLAEDGGLRTVIARDLVRMHYKMEKFEQVISDVGTVLADRKPTESDFWLLEWKVLAQFELKQDSAARSTMTTLATRDSQRFSNTRKKINEIIARRKAEQDATAADNSDAPADSDPLLLKAEQGDPEAQFQLGVKLVRSKQFDEAKKWLEKAAEQDHRSAKAFLKRLDSFRRQ